MNKMTPELKTAFEKRKASFRTAEAATAAPTEAPTSAAAATAADAKKESGKGRFANENGPKKIKLVLTGDTATGKSCLITNYLNNSFSDDYEPTVLDVYKGIKNVKKKQIEIEIHDTSGDEHLGVNRKV